MKVLAGQILASQGRYACLLFDPHGEYLEGGGGLAKGLRHHPWAADRLKVYATRAAGAGATALRLALAELTQGDLQTAYQWSHAQEDAIWRLVRYFGEDWIVTGGRGAGRRRRSPSDLGVATSTLQVIQRRAQRILEMPCISRDPSQPSLSKRIVEELTDGYSRARRHLRAVLDGGDPGRVGDHADGCSRRTRSLYLEDRDRFDALPPTLVALEEAQRVLSRVAQRRERVPAARARGPQVQGRAVRRLAAAEADRRRAAVAVQHVLHPRPGRREAIATSCAAARSRTSPTSGPRSRR